MDETSRHWGDEKHTFSSKMSREVTNCESRQREKKNIKMVIVLMSNRHKLLDPVYDYCCYLLS
jgi:hypothetical protein